MKKLVFLGIVIGIIIISLFTALKFYLKKDASQNTSRETLLPSATPAPTIANPASTNCLKQGGTLTIQKRGDGGAYGLCTFEDNRACEEWALMNKQCPVGGIKTTGYDTIEQKYCAWRGGKTQAVDHATCTLPSGQVCDAKQLFDGVCFEKNQPAS